MSMCTSVSIERLIDSVWESLRITKRSSLWSIWMTMTSLSFNDYDFAIKLCFFFFFVLSCCKIRQGFFFARILYNLKDKTLGLFFTRNKKFSEKPKTRKSYSKHVSRYCPWNFWLYTSSKSSKGFICFFLCIFLLKTLF